MPIQQILEKVTSTLGARLVYAEAIERDGVTVVPAAMVRGGGGGGGGTDASGEGGEGGGFGITAKPAGALVIDGDRVRWKPALDATRIVVAMLTVVGLAMLLRYKVVRAQIKAAS